MQRRHWIIAGVVGAAVAAGGGAFAATKLESPSARSQAIIFDAAGQLGIDPAKLTSALQKAIDDQIDAEVKAGTITKAEGDALKQRVDSGRLPLFGGFGGEPGRFGFHRGFRLFGVGPDAAASYLGISTDELRTELRSGKTLAQIATARGKTADGLVDALVASAKQKLDQAVKDGRLSSDQEQTVLGRLRTAIQAMVNGTMPAPGMGPGGFGFGFQRHFGAPPPASA